MSAREAPEFCKLTLVDNCSGGSEEQMLKEAKTVKTVLVTVALRRTQGKQESSREMGQKSSQLPSSIKFSYILLISQIFECYRIRQRNFQGIDIFRT